MQHSPRSSRPISRLSDSIHKQLNMYALAASAGSVGVLALTQPVEAKIVYTPVNIPIAQNGSVQLDLNHDGITDFTVSSLYQGITTFDFVAILGVTGGNPNDEVLWSGAQWAAPLGKNVRIGAKDPFRSGFLYMAIVSRDYERRGSEGPWVGNKQAYLGLKFQIGSKTHYGWARLHVTTLMTSSTPRLITAIVTGYAYETIPNKAIATGRTKGRNKDGNFEPPNPAALQPSTRKPSSGLLTGYEAIPNKPIIAGQTEGRDDISSEAPDAALTTLTPEAATLGALAIGSSGLSTWRREQSALATD
jgi:hypothetical protein